jgi:hypothetical protein
MLQLVCGNAEGSQEFEIASSPTESIVFIVYRMVVLAVNWLLVCERIVMFFPLGAGARCRKDKYIPEITLQDWQHNTS